MTDDHSEPYADKISMPDKVISFVKMYFIEYHKGVLVLHVEQKKRTVLMWS